MSKRAWKVLRLDGGRIVSKYDGSPWTVGEWRSVKPPTAECVGLNASPTIAEAEAYVRLGEGAVLARVEYEGKTIRSGGIGERKVTCERMRILRAWRVTPEAQAVYDKARSEARAVCDKACSEARAVYDKARSAAVRRAVCRKEYAL